MSLVGFRATNHPQQVRSSGPLDDTDDRRTPDCLWSELDSRFMFTLDAAARAYNSKTPSFCEDGLECSWGHNRVWCNPPYSNVSEWVRKAWREHNSGCPLIVMLLPANRTEQGWWQDLIEPVRDKPGGAVTTEFLRGRIRFDRPGWVKPAKGDRPPFGCVLVVWRRHAEDCDMDDDCKCGVQ